MRLTSRATILVLLLFAAVADLRAERWLEVESPNFRVISNGSAGQAGEIAQQFEQFRRVIQGALPGMSVDPGQPIVILAVQNESQLRELIPQYWTRKNGARPAGIFLRGPERHYVALRTNIGGDRPFQTVYHEYFHLLVSLNLPRVPLWLNEGLAEFYANTKFRKSDVVFGLPSESHVGLLRRSELLPLATLFEVDEDSPHYNESNKASIFYSQSWALTHYLLLHSSQESPRPLDRLLQLLADEVPAREAIRQSLGSLTELQSQLKNYLRGEEFYYLQYPEAVKVATDSFSRRVLSSAEADSLRAAFLVRNGQHDGAEKLIRSALRADPELPLVHESLGFLRYDQGRLAEALEAFDQAIRLGSESYLSHYFYGFLSLTDASDPAIGEEVERTLRRAIELRPSFPFAYTALATLLLQGGRHLDEALDLARHASRLEPRNPQLLQTLAYAFSRLERMDQAEEVLGQIYVWARSEQDLTVARQVEESLSRFREYLQEKDRYETSLAAMEQERIALQQGRGLASLEVEGDVRSVNCAAPASIELVVRSGTRQVTLVSRNLPLVEFFFLGEKPGAEFHPCQNLQGRTVRAAYRPDPETSVNRLVSIQVP